MTSAFRHTATVCLLALAASAAVAETHPLDDSLSHTVPPTAQMQWLPQTRGDQAGGMEAWVRVNIHIDTQDWIGRSGRVYMVLPRDETASLEAVWTTDGKLLAGRLVSGERALVYAGNITTSALRDQMLVRLRSGPDWQSNSRRLNFHFEIDVDSPPATLRP
jgi:hypothetical protein